MRPLMPPCHLRTPLFCPSRRACIHAPPEQGPPGFEGLLQIPALCRKGPGFFWGPAYLPHAWSQTIFRRPGNINDDERHLRALRIAGSGHPGLVSPHWRAPVALPFSFATRSGFQEMLPVPDPVRVRDEYGGGQFPRRRRLAAEPEAGLLGQFVGFSGIDFLMG